MPIYEFKCQSCGQRFEKLLFSSQLNSKIDCPDCKSTTVERIFSVFGFSTGTRTVTSTPGGGSCHTCSSHHCSTCHH
ncbi:zinc ribbon domain-containing protein [candidate division KSB1 bacterium]|nr:zinc ribbon domain-containing protein [candidate division KSB1 bacterium]